MGVVLKRAARLGLAPEYQLVRLQLESAAAGVLGSAAVEDVDAAAMVAAMEVIAAARLDAIEVQLQHHQPLQLWLKVARNVVHVAVAIVWAPVAAVLALIPSTAHIGRLWAHESSAAWQGCSSPGPCERSRPPHAGEHVLHGRQCRQQALQ